MQAGVRVSADKILTSAYYKNIREMEVYRYARDISTVRLVNIETGKTDYVPKSEIREFWDNLAEDDKIEMAGWTYEQFLERLNKAYCYYLKRNNKVIAIGGTYPDDLNICLWLLVIEKTSKYPLTLIRAVRKGVKKELRAYPEPFDTVLAIPNSMAIDHNRFVERVLQMKVWGSAGDNLIWIKDKKGLLECVSQ